MSAAQPGAEYGTPTPCTVCGAMMVPTDAAALHSNPEWVCRYCGYREALPVDAAERHRHLRLRLMQLTRARESVEAPLKTLQSLDSTWPVAIAFMTAMGAWQSFTFFSAGRGAQHGVAGVYALFPLAIAVGMSTGWLGMRHTFKKQLRPLMRARPPLQPGLSARCRSCGGDLPHVRAPEVTCRYCGASNLFDNALTTEASALLVKEAEAYQRHVMPWARDPSVYLAPSRAFYRYGAIGAVLALAVGGAIWAVIGG